MSIILDTLLRPNEYAKSKNGEPKIAILHLSVAITPPNILLMYAGLS